MLGLSLANGERTLCDALPARSAAAATAAASFLAAAVRSAACVRRRSSASSTAARAIALALRTCFEAPGVSESDGEAGKSRHQQREGRSSCFSDGLFG